MDEHPNREISPRTTRNFRHAQACVVPLTGSMCLVLNFNTGRVKLLPERIKEDIPWWMFEDQVRARARITRWYWLMFGVGLVRIYKE